MPARRGVILSSTRLYLDETTLRELESRELQRATTQRTGFSLLFSFSSLSLSFSFSSLLSFFHSCPPFIYPLSRRRPRRRLRSSSSSSSSCATRLRDRSKNNRGIPLALSRRRDRFEPRHAIYQTRRSVGSTKFSFFLLHSSSPSNILLFFLILSLLCFFFIFFSFFLLSRGRKSLRFNVHTTKTRRRLSK